MKNRNKLIPFEKIHKEWMKNPEFVREFDKLQPEFALAGALIEARTKRKISQAEIAKRAGTDQAVISRLEGAKGKPSLSLIQRVAEALELKVELRLTPK